MAVVLGIWKIFHDTSQHSYGSMDGFLIYEVFTLRDLGGTKGGGGYFHDSRF